MVSLVEVGGWVGGGGEGRGRGSPGDHGQVGLWERRTGPDTAAPLALLGGFFPPFFHFHKPESWPPIGRECLQEEGRWWRAVVAVGAWEGGGLKPAPVKAAAIIITPKGAELWRRNVCTELLQCV